MKFMLGLKVPWDSRVDHQPCCYEDMVTMATKKSQMTLSHEGLWSSSKVGGSFRAAGIDHVCCCYGAVVTMTARKNK